MLWMTAFAAGLLSFFSPCILPVVPGYLAYLSKDTPFDRDPREVNWHAFRRALSFVAGFSLVFILMGLSASGIGQLLIAYQSIITIVGGAVIILFGLHMMELFQLPVLMRGGFSPPKVGSGFFLGVIFSVAWTPCVGPFLASILIIAGTEASLPRALGLLFFYALGMAIPFLLAALFWGRLLAVTGKAARYSAIIHKVAGALLVVLGILIVTGRFSILTATLGV